MGRKHQGNSHTHTHTTLRSSPLPTGKKVTPFGLIHSSAPVCFTSSGAFFPPWPWTHCSLFLELPFLLDLTLKLSRIVFKYCLVPDNFLFPKMIIILLSVPPLCKLVNSCNGLFACLCCYVVTLTNRNLAFTNGCHQNLAQAHECWLRITVMLLLKIFMRLISYE